MKIEGQRNAEIIGGGGVMAGHKLDLTTGFEWSYAGKNGEAEQTTNNKTINQANNTLVETPGSCSPTLSLGQ